MPSPVEPVAVTCSLISVNTSETTTWQRRIERSIAAVRAWEKRIPKPDHIQPGSSLSADDSAWPDLPASRVAWED